MKNNRIMRRLLHWGLRLLFFVFIFSILVYFIFPPLVSSDRAREKTSLFLAQSFRKPVSLKALDFSWKDGVSISELNITNCDRTPLLMIHSIQILPDWRALLAIKLKVASLIIKGITLTLIRDKNGKMCGYNPTGFLSNKRTALPHKKFSPAAYLPASHKKKRPGRFKHFFASFPDAHITEGVFTFIDQRLNTTTQIKNFSADLKIRSLRKPVTFLLQGMVARDNNPPEPMTINGSVNLFSIKNLPRARGRLSLQSGFGNAEGFFNLDKFNTSSTEAIGGHLTCSLDLEKLSKMLAGILGFPPGYSWKGTLHSSFEARGNFASLIVLTGATQVTDASLSGETFPAVGAEHLHTSLTQKIFFDFPAQKIIFNVFNLSSELLNLSLSGTISDFLKHPSGNLTLSGNGDLKGLTDILKIFSCVSPDLYLSGITHLSLSGTGPAKEFHLKGSAVVRDFTVEHPALKGQPFYEKNLRIFPDLLCNLRKYRITIPSLLIQAKSLTGEIKGRVKSPGDIDLEGSLSIKLAELKKQLPELLPQYFPSEGESSSHFTIQRMFNDSIMVKGNHALPFFPKLNITHDFIYSPEQDSITFKTLTAEFPGLNFNGRGTISQISTNPFVKSEGEFSLVLEEAQKVWKDSLPKKMILQGSGSITFAAEGNLKPAADKPAFYSWIGHGALFLDNVIYEGLGAIQNLQSTAWTFEKGVLTLALEGLLNNGPVSTQSTIDLNQKRPMIHLKGQGENIELSPDQTLLEYVIPISSRASHLTGKGSFFLQASWAGTDWKQEISKRVVGEGEITLQDGTIKSEGSLSEILHILGKSDAIEFDQIICPFRLGEEKIYDNTIKITGNDIELGLEGWTSLSYDPEKKGNPILYTVTGASVKKSHNKNANKIIPFLGNNDLAIPIVIKGTVQKPKVSVKFPKAKKFFKEFFNPPEDDSSPERDKA